MGLFDKKYCDICGEKIGLLGNRKLENGNLCKNCALSRFPQKAKPFCLPKDQEGRSDNPVNCPTAGNPIKRGS